LCCVVDHFDPHPRKSLLIGSTRSGARQSTVIISANAWSLQLRPTNIAGVREADGRHATRRLRTDKVLTGLCATDEFVRFDRPNLL